MNTKVEYGVSRDNCYEDVPLLLQKTVERSTIQRAITQTFQSTAHLANLLPTGSVLAFQLLSPIFTNQGECDSVHQSMTAMLIGMCGLWIKGATFVMVLPRLTAFGSSMGPQLYHELAAKYSLKFIDFMHAFMSVLIFAAVALFDHEVVNCFYPTPLDETKELLTTLPLESESFVVCYLLYSLPNDMGLASLLLPVKVFHCL